MYPLNQKTPNIMRIITLLSFIILTLSAGTINAATTSRTIAVSEEINALVTSCNVDVTYTVTPGPVKVTVTGPDDIVPLVKVATKGKTLNIGIEKSKKYGWQKTKGLKVNVNGPVLYAVKAYTSSDINFTNALNTGDRPLKLYADTSADITIPEIATTGTVTIKADTSADIKIRNVKADKLSVNANTSADVDIATVNVTSVNLEADTSADIKVNKATVGIIGTRADTSADIKIMSLSARILDAAAETGGDIKISSGRIDKVRATATTGGDIDLKGVAITTIEKSSASTGGSIKTK